MRSLIIISNDEIYINDNSISSNYNDTINIIDGLKNYFNIEILSRKSSKKKAFSTKINKNIKFYIKSKKKNNIKVLMLSITPLNILNFLILSFHIKKLKLFTLLRSDGYKEYFLKYWWIGYFIYHLLYFVVKKKSKIMSVSKNLTNVSTNCIIEPSELDQSWFNRRKRVSKPKPKLLYLGRYRKEKGIFSVIKIFQSAKINYDFTFAGDNINLIKANKNIKVLEKINSQKKIIKLYDDNAIFILPSYTEGSPKVLKESLARLRPVVIFEEIRHVKKKYFGVYICKRSINDLERKIKFILNNYRSIQEKMKKNHLNTKKNFQRNLLDALKY